MASSQGNNSNNNNHVTSLDNFLPGSASLVDMVDHQLLVTLRDGKHYYGFLRTYDQFANLVLSNTIERIFLPARKEYADIPQGFFLIRGENVVLLGEIGNGSSNQQQQHQKKKVIKPQFTILKKKKTSSATPSLDAAGGGGDSDEVVAPDEEGITSSKIEEDVAALTINNTNNADDDDDTNNLKGQEYEEDEEIIPLQHPPPPPKGYKEIPIPEAKSLQLSLMAEKMEKIRRDGRVFAKLGFFVDHLEGDLY